MPNSNKSWITADEIKESDNQRETIEKIKNNIKRPKLNNKINKSKNNIKNAIQFLILNEKKTKEITNYIKSYNVYINQNFDNFEIDFKWCKILENYDLSNILMLNILWKFIIKIYKLPENSTITFVKNKTISINSEKNKKQLKEKRLNWYSEKELQTLIDSFIWEIDFYKLVSDDIDYIVNKSTVSENHLKDFLSWWYKSKIIELVSNKIIKLLPDILTNYINDKLLWWIAQYLYRNNFENINKELLSKFHKILNENIDSKIDNKINFLVISKIDKLTKFNFSATRLNTTVAKEIFEQEIKPLIEYRTKMKQVSINKNDLNNPFEKENIIYDLIINKWSLILSSNIIDFSKDYYNLDIDKWLVWPIALKNITKRETWSILFHISKEILFFIEENIKIRHTINWFKDLISVYDGKSIKDKENSIKKIKPKLSIWVFDLDKKYYDIATDFMRQFELIISSKNWTYNEILEIDDNQLIKNIYNTFNDISANLISNKQVPKWSYNYYRLINAFAYNLLKKTTIIK